MDIHDDVRPLAFLIGTWQGTGRGEYPTIEPFTYTEVITFTPGPGKPFLAYTQRTAHAETGAPLHSEAGYLRGSPTDEVEFVIAQPTGIVEILVGRRTATSLDLHGTASATPRARSVTATRRSIHVAGDTLSYRLAMAAVGLTLQHHLEAHLRRVEG